MIKVVLQLLIAVILFLGGIWLLALRIPGWGLFFGLPAVQIGIVLLIFTFDKLSHEVLNDYLNNQTEITCLVCGKKTSTPIFVDGGLCSVCKRRKMKKTKKET